MPNVRARACAGWLWALIVSACAHAPPPRSAPDPELARLKIALAEREQVIARLEGRLALREARAELVSSGDEAEVPPRELPEARAAKSEAALEEPPSERISEGARPLLRLHNDRPGAPSWSPPTASERLTVAPLPSFSGGLPTREEAAEDLYVRALDLVRRRAFPDALRELDGFLASFPDDPRATRAQFWRGEVLFAQREYGAALAAFEVVLARSPHGEQVPEVLLRLARCSLRVGATARARALLEQLEAEYPDSEAARTVRRGGQEDS